MSFGGGGATGRGEATWAVPKRPPPSIVCYVCGRSYGTASYSIHLKQCIKRFEDEELQKPKSQRRPLPQAPSTAALAESGAAGFPGSAAARALALEAHNEAAFRQYNDVSLVPCSFCGRTFSGPDRLKIHNRACTVDHPSRKVGEKGVNNGGAPTAFAAVVSSPGRQPHRDAEAEEAPDAGEDDEDADADGLPRHRHLIGSSGSGARAAAAAQRSPPVVRAEAKTDGGDDGAEADADDWRASLLERFELLAERADELEAHVVAELRDLRFEMSVLAKELRDT